VGRQTEFEVLDSSCRPLLEIKWNDESSNKIFLGFQVKYFFPGKVAQVRGTKEALFGDLSGQAENGPERTHINCPSSD
jgi:hypothetical protein